MEAARAKTESGGNEGGRRVAQGEAGGTLAGSFSALRTENLCREKPGTERDTRASRATPIRRSPNARRLPVKRVPLRDLAVA
eukprot:1564946-Rhodomonas_salina.2